MPNSSGCRAVGTLGSSGPLDRWNFSATSRRACTNPESHSTLAMVSDPPLREMGLKKVRRRTPDARGATIERPNPQPRRLVRKLVYAKSSPPEATRRPRHPASSSAAGGVSPREGAPRGGSDPPREGTPRRRPRAARRARGERQGAEGADCEFRGVVVRVAPSLRRGSLATGTRPRVRTDRRRHLLAPRVHRPPRCRRGRRRVARAPRASRGIRGAAKRPFGPGD